MDLSKISRHCTQSDIVACFLLVTIIATVSMPSSVRVVNGGKLSTPVQAPVAAARGAISARAGLADRSSHPHNPVLTKSAIVSKRGKSAERNLREAHSRSSSHEARLDSNVVSD